MEEDKDVAKLIDEMFDNNLDASFQVMEAQWYRNILYFLGEQWIQYMQSSRTFTRRYYKKGTKLNIPTPVSNIIRPHVKSIRALFLNRDYNISVFPNSKDREDIDASTIGKKFLESLDSDNDYEFEDIKNEIVVWLCCAGTAFIRTFGEVDGGGIIFDSNGKLIKKGDVGCETIIPFNVRVDNFGDKLRRKRHIGIQSLKPKEWVEDTFGVKVSSERDTNMIDYQRRLMELVAEPGHRGGVTSGVGSLRDDELVLYRELECKPSKEYPNGRYVVRCSGQTIFDKGVMPIPVDKGAWDYSLTDFHYNPVPGRFWSDPSINDLISPQDKINQIDQDQELNRRGFGKPWMLVSTGTTFKRKTSEGQPLKVVEYDALLSGGQRPQVQHPAPLPSSVVIEREVHQQAAQDSSGDPKNVLRGNSPSSQASGIMVDILRDTAEQGHQPDINFFYRRLTAVYRKRLRVAREIFTEERTRKIGGKGRETEIFAFKGADLKGNTDVRLELASGISTTKAGKIQTTIRLSETGFFGDLTQRPKIRHKLLRDMGLAGIEEDESVDIERAELEHSKIKSDDFEGIFLSDKMPLVVPDENGKEKPVIDPKTRQPIMVDTVVMEDPMFKYDNHGVHYDTHRTFILSREFLGMEEKQQVVLIAHADIHHKIMQAEIEAMKKEQMAMLKAEKGQPEQLEAPEGAMA